MDPAELSPRLGQGLTVTVDGNVTTVVALDLRPGHVLLADWSAPPDGDGSLTEPRWVDAAAITSAASYAYDPAEDGEHPAPPGPADDPDPQVDPTALTYPAPPEEAP